MKTKSQWIQAQQQDFPEEYKLSKCGNEGISQSRLAELAPEYDQSTGLIRVSGCLHQSEDLELDAIHPIVLDPKNPVTKLLIANIDSTLCHPGSQSVRSALAEVLGYVDNRQ